MPRLNIGITTDDTRVYSDTRTWMNATEYGRTSSTVEYDGTAELEVEYDGEVVTSLESIITDHSYDQKSLSIIIRNNGDGLLRLNDTKSIEITSGRESITTSDIPAAIAPWDEKQVDIDISILEEMTDTKSDITIRIHSNDPGNETFSFYIAAPYGS